MKQEGNSGDGHADGLLPFPLTEKEWQRARDRLNRSLARRNDKTLAVQGFGSFCHFPLLGTLQ